MRKSKAGAEDEFGDLHFQTEDADADDFGVGHAASDSLGNAANRNKPARQRVELRAEQRTLREQLSDWDDYNEDFDTNL